VHPLIEQHRQEIEALCRRYQVRRLEVFGSAARGDDFDPSRSDVDLLVEYEAENSPPAFAEFLDLREQLAAVIGRPVDLVMVGSVPNPFIKADIERSKEPIYAS
jgi:predicted nucleotidyltransferase